MTFAKDQTPPAYGFWSLTLYDAHHFFVPNAFERYSVGTKNKDLQTNADGSLTISVQSAEDASHRRLVGAAASPRGAVSEDAVSGTAAIS